MNARDNMHRTGSCTDGGFAKASARFGVVTAQGGWRKVTWGVVAGVAAVATAGSLMVPSAAIAAEWVDVGGTSTTPAPRQATRPAPGAGTAPTI